MKLHPDRAEFIALLNRHGADYMVIGRDALIRNKNASGRHQDLFDVEALGG